MENITVKLKIHHKPHYRKATRDSLNSQMTKPTSQSTCWGQLQMCSNLAPGRALSLHPHFAISLSPSYKNLPSRICLNWLGVRHSLTVQPDRSPTLDLPASASEHSIFDTFLTEWLRRGALLARSLRIPAATYKDNRLADS